MSYNLDNDYLQTDDSIDIDFGVILNGMEGADLWNDLDEEMAVYDASTPEFIRDHDAASVFGGSADV